MAETATAANTKSEHAKKLTLNSCYGSFHFISVNCSFEVSVRSCSFWLNSTGYAGALVNALYSSGSFERFSEAAAADFLKRRQAHRLICLSP